jgi:GT2 family glycosyltransferase
LFLNPDTRLPVGSLGSLWEAVERYGTRALIGARHYADEDCRYAHAPLRATRWGDEAWDLVFARGWAGGRPDRYLERRWRVFSRRGPVRWRAISGGCLGTARETFERLGGWDERFWMYGEDVELCLRARRRGVRVLYFPEIPVVHYMEASARQLPERGAAARRLGRDQLKIGHYGRSASWVERVLTRGVGRLIPRRADPWADLQELESGRLRRQGGDGPWAVELAYSPLFDNCLTCFPEASEEAVPEALIAGLPPGRYYLRTAERRDGRFRNTGLWYFEGGVAGGASCVATNRMADEVLA